MRLIKNKKLGDFFRHHRIQAGFTQQEVADDFKFKSPQFISNIERGVCPIPHWAVRYFVEKYNIDTDILMRELVDVYKSSWAKDFGHNLLHEKSACL